jgi:hypothetical protein
MLPPYQPPEARPLRLRPFFDDAPSTRFDRQIDRLPTAAAAGGGGGEMVLPFKIVDVSPDEDTPTIKVTYGTVMDILPTDVDTDLACAATMTFYLDCTIDTVGVVTAVELANGASVPANSDTHAYLLVGVVTITGTVVSAISQSLYFSQGFKACDRVVVDDVVTVRGTYEFFVR